MKIMEADEIFGFLVLGDRPIFDFLPSFKKEKNCQSSIVN